MKHISLEKLWHNGKLDIVLLVCMMLISVTACGRTDSVEDNTTALQEVLSIEISEPKVAEDVNVSNEYTIEAETGERNKTPNEKPEREAKTMVLDINGEIVSVAWEDNESVSALKQLVLEEPLSIQMSMYGGFEQVGSIGTSLPRNDEPTTTEAGDIVLYSGNQIVVFYGSNSWDYTRLGKVADKSKAEMTDLLGNGDVTITISSK